VTDGDHDNDGSHANDDAEHRQERPHLVLQNALRRDGQ
jgi:hypothetical protein